MGRLGTFLIGFLLGGVSVYVGLHYHFVRAADGWHTIPKVTSTFDETYVDIRQFGFAEWREHPELFAAITKAEKTELLSGTVTAPIRDAVQQAVDALQPE